MNDKNKFKNDKLMDIISEFVCNEKITKKNLYDMISCSSYNRLINKFDLYLKRLSEKIKIDEDILKTAYEIDELKRLHLYVKCNSPGCKNRFIPKSKFNKKCPTCKTLNYQDDVEIYEVLK